MPSFFIFRVDGSVSIFPNKFLLMNFQVLKRYNESPRKYMNNSWNMKVSSLWI